LEPPRRDPMLDFAVKDTWRILPHHGGVRRGFETLSTIMGVSIFGRARSEPGSPDYRAEAMGGPWRARLRVITGGDRATWKAAQQGRARGRGESVGLAVELRTSRGPTRTYPITLSSAILRAPHVRKYSQAFVIMPGGSARSTTVRGGDAHPAKKVNPSPFRREDTIGTGSWAGSSRWCGAARSARRR